jgi:hypothetical protein
MTAEQLFVFVFVFGRLRQSVSLICNICLLRDHTRYMGKPPSIDSKIRRFCCLRNNLLQSEQPLLSVVMQDILVE